MRNSPIRRIILLFVAHIYCLPSSMARMNKSKFIVYTFVGSFIWCWVLGYAGVKAGENWEALGKYFHQFHYVIIAAGVAFVIWYLRRHFKNN